MAEMFRHSSVALCSALAAATSLAQPAPQEAQAPQTLVADKPVSLVTKTPLGDAAVQIAPGTTLTNFEMQGERVKIWQGPFTATVDLAEVQASASGSPAAPEPSAAPSPAASPEPSAAATPEEPQASAPAEVATALPSWVLPAVCGALAAYAFFATLALLRSRRKTSAAPPAKVATNTPVVTLPTKAAPKPAVVSDEGRAIACPLCGKSIPLEKVIKGRNRCPSCQGNFVVE
jgi:hypothetical protein